MDPLQLRRVMAADLPDGPDPVAAWIRLDLLTRRVIGRHLELGATPATDEALDKLMVLRAWTARPSRSRTFACRSLSATIAGPAR
jgi:hypothetical protein